MSRFNKYISAAVSIMLVVMAFSAIGTNEAEASGKGRKSKSTLGSGKATSPFPDTGNRFWDTGTGFRLLGQRPITTSRERRIYYYGSDVGLAGAKARKDKSTPGPGKATASLQSSSLLEGNPDRPLVTGSARAAGTSYYVGSANGSVWKTTNNVAGGDVNNDGKLDAVTDNKDPEGKRRRLFSKENIAGVAGKTKTTTSQTSYILPYIEQDNLYKFRRP